jgi:AcrR family transcriptional regulator
MMGGSPRWQRRPDARREAILAAALSVFDREGVDSARMDDIASAAAISKGSVYRYFPDKDSLFLAVVSESLKSLVPARSGLNDPISFFDRAWTLITNPRFRAAYRLALTETRFTEARSALDTHINNSLIEPLAELIGRTERGATLIPADRRGRAQLAIATMLGAALQGVRTAELRTSAVPFLVRACEMDSPSPQADGY